MNIVEKIEQYLNRFMAFPNPDYATVCALWVLHTWTFSESFPKRPYATPYLYIKSMGPRSGKTLLIDLLEKIVLNPERTISMTSSVMFRLIESVQPTLFIDEVDTIFDGTRQSELQNVINGGYVRSGYIWRNAPGKDGPEPTKFATFCPKLLAGIDNEKLSETIQTRSIHLELVRATSVNDDGEIVAADGTTREIHYDFISEPLAEHLVAEIEAFIAQWKAEWKEEYIPKPTKGMEPRSWQIAMPLIQIAARIGIEERAREILSSVLAPRPEKDTPEISMLRGIKAAFDELEADKLHSATICEYLGEGWNGKLLSNRVSQFVSGTSTTMNIGNRVAKGYYRYQFEAAWIQYL